MSVKLYWQRCEHCSSKARAAVVDPVAFSSGNCALLVGVIDVDGVGDVCSRRGVEGPLTGAGIGRPGGGTERVHCRFQDCDIASCVCPPHFSGKGAQPMMPQPCIRTPNLADCPSAAASCGGAALCWYSARPCRARSPLHHQSSVGGGDKAFKLQIYWNRIMVSSSQSVRASMIMGVCVRCV